MAQDDLEQALRNFDQAATLLSEEGRRQVWQFDFGGRSYFVHFYPRRRGLTRLWRGGSALMEFIHLRSMQRASVPSPRAVAHLSGLKINRALGDAMVVETIPNAIPLDQYLRDRFVHGQPIPHRNNIADQVIHIIHEIGRAKFGFANLHMGCFLIDDENKVYLHDVRGLRGGGLRLKDVFTFGHHAAQFATRAELLRGWIVLNPDAPFPRQNPLSVRLRRRFLRRCRIECSDVGKFRTQNWSGYYNRSWQHAQPWSAASRLKINQRDWESAWPALLAQLESDQLLPIKQDSSGDVFEAEVVLAGHPIPVIVKRPRRKKLHRYVVDLFRPARALRMWIKAWSLIARNLPCEWPMLVMQRKVLGYVVDAVIVFERVPGEVLARVDLDSLPPAERDMLFRRAGRILRTIEGTGLVHYDSKSTNWIVYRDPAHGAIPVMIDVDGIRPLNFFLQGWSILRLLRAMKLHPQYTPADSLTLCLGYAPFAPGLPQEEIQESEQE